jgi:hypothetical protein
MRLYFSFFNDSVYSLMSLSFIGKLRYKLPFRINHAELSFITFLLD